MYNAPPHPLNEKVGCAKGGPSMSSEPTATDESPATPPDKTIITEHGYSNLRWYSEGIHDRNTILQKYPGQFAKLWAMWTALLVKSSFKKSLTITMADDLVARDCGISRATVSRLKDHLQKIGLVKCSAKKWDKKKKQMAPTVWRLIPTVKPYHDKQVNSEDVGGLCIKQTHSNLCSNGNGTQMLQTLTSHSLGPPKAPQRNERCRGLSRKKQKSSFSATCRGPVGAPASAKDFSSSEEKPKSWREIADEVAAERKAAAAGGGK